jgi:hypothetical protein
MANYGSTLSINSLPISAAATSSRRLRGSAALIGVFVVLCCLSYASLQSHLPAQVIALAAQQQLTPVAPLKISFDAKIGGADPRTHLNTFALSNVQLSGDPKWKDFANRALPPTPLSSLPPKARLSSILIFNCRCHSLPSKTLQQPRRLRRGQVSGQRTALAESRAHAHEH